MKYILLLLALGLVVACSSSKKNGEKSAEEISMERFEGNFKVGDIDPFNAIVFPMYHSFEVELQIAQEPIIFFFDSLDSQGQFVYTSDDQSMSFRMESDHKKGLFYEINEPEQKVTKE
ncbi:hypothetical protein BFP72_11735 [Reichenbachiella sp. 5M10]|uniref:hypothetical protein n=1 Tax=Reichenbachiella sp. 5M10 TaxID=1889772 RepID=UPI000C149668|nr:hypothetical protein [Reichenbachiella sp. 5M10]PIB36017.1 hypothetical protein BFP72_11735 [Reichenbachiella sp. 5M10]